MKREPILIIAAANIFLQAVVVLIATIWTDWSKEETVAVSGVIAAALNLAGAFFGRSLITPTADPKDNNGTPLVRNDAPAAGAQGMAAAEGQA